MTEKRTASTGTAPPVAAPPSDPAAIEQASQALFRLGRVFARRPLRDQLAASTPDTDLSAVLVVQTVQELSTSGGVPTIGAVAVRLAFDPSTASRLVAQTVGAGYLERSPGAGDGRVVVLHLTAAGEALAAAAASHQRAIFEQLTEDWSAADRGQFARLFVQFAAAAGAMLAEHDRPANG